MSQLLESVENINLDDPYIGLPLPEDISIEELRELTGVQVVAQRIDETGAPLVIGSHDKISYVPNENPKRRIRTERIPATVIPAHIGRLSVSAANMIHITPDVRDGETAPTAVIPLSGLRYGEYTLRLLHTTVAAEDSAA